MHSQFNFEALFVFGFMAIMLLIGIVARARLKFIQRYLFPSCLIGGLLGMALVNMGFFERDFLNLARFSIDNSDFEFFAYHFFNISFISVGLTGAGKEGGGAGKTLVKGAIWMALMQGICFPIQGILGGVLVYIFNALGFDLYNTFGFLAPLAFNEGPGQALSIGKVWEGFGFEHAATIGLTFATIGFFFAFFVGVPIANWGIRKGLALHSPKELPKKLITGVSPRDEQENAGKLTLYSGAVETLAFQAAMVGLTYFITYLFVNSLDAIIGGENAKILWGFFFFFGLLIAILLRNIMKIIGIDYLLDPGVQKRITGFSVDFLIVATVSAIQITVVSQFILPIAVIGILTGASTVFVIMFFGRRLDKLNLERSLAIYGTNTGVVSSGLLLLRIVDPEFESPVAMELGMMNIFAAPIIVGGLLLLNAPVVQGWSPITAMLILAAISAASIVLLKVLNMWGMRRY